MNNNPLTPDAEIRAQARRWFLTLQDNPGRRQRAACEKWRRSSPAHEEAWLAVEAIWQESERPGRQLAGQEADVLSGYLAAMDDNRRRRARRRRLGALGTCCLLLLVLAGGWLQYPGWLQMLSADHLAARGERRDVQLADGSQVLLDADSALSVDFTPDARRVRLLRGAAYFDVVKSTTPFIVDTAAGSVQVLGTRFDVRLQGEGALVTLARGSVAVTAGGTGSPVLLKPGQQLAFGPHAVGTPVGVSVADAMAWHGGRYIFYRARLADVVQEVERYRAGRVLIPSAALGDRRVTGSFSLADTDAALDSLQASVGFRLRRVTDLLVIISP